MHAEASVGKPDAKHVGGTTLEDDAFLAAACDLYEAARVLSALAAERMRDPHKYRRLAAIAAHKAVAEASRAAEEAIDDYMHSFRQPVTFTHRGWRWSIPSQPRGLICTREGREPTRCERKEGLA